ncbi:MAG: efflux RND transporter periplasmic adaptor subunit [Pseudomonadota bacterium]|jgi:RND family efflux transporter MFP subunit
MSEERHRPLAIHPIEDVDPATLPGRRATLARAKWLTLGVLVLLALGGIASWAKRSQAAAALAAGTPELGRVHVRVTQPRLADKGQTVQLPGTLQGYTQAPIAARTSGYLKRWHRDIGSRVQAGELLAEIETPEIDQQLAQAIAAREQAASSLALASSTLARWEALRRKDAVSQQDLDERRSNEAQARANLAAADANVARLRQLEGFKRIVAPFPGVITRRNVDVGDLIDAGGGASRALFVLSQTDPIRVYVNVPQSYSNVVRAGQGVEVSQAELPGRTFSGKVVRTAGAIDPATRTMVVEVNLANRDGVLLPGAFVSVALPLKASELLLIETNTLIFRSEGIRVASVDAEGVVTLRPVRIGRNLGPVVQVLDGLSREERVVLNPPDSLGDGDRVNIVTTPPRGASGKDAKKDAGDAGKAGSRSGDPSAPGKAATEKGKS